jgi:cytochrome c biogenesis protein
MISAEDFIVELDERSYISDYVCEVNFRDEAGEPVWYNIRPNHPLKIAGWEIYLVSYRDDPEIPEGFVLSGSDSAGGLVMPHVFAGVGDPVYVEELAATVQASIGVVPSLRLITDDGKVETYIIEDERTQFDHGGQQYRFTLVHMVPSLLVTLEVVREPGQGFIIAGFVLLTLGTFMSLYLSHRRIWFIVETLPGDKSKVTFGGRANRNRDGFSREFGAIRDTLDELS